MACLQLVVEFFRNLKFIKVVGSIGFSGSNLCDVVWLVGFRVMMVLDGGERVSFIFVGLL